MPALPATDEPIPLGSIEWWQARQVRLGRRRPRADGLTIEIIVDRALALVDEEGLDALTVRALAGRLETGGATLYRHVASREELLVLLVDHVIGEVERPDPELGPRARIEALAGGLRDVLLRHENLAPALLTAPLQGPNVTMGTEVTLAAFLDAGFDVDDAISGYFAMLDYVLGAVVFASARVERHQAGPGRADPEHLPVLAHVMAGATWVDPDTVFRRGLASFLDGLGLPASDAPG